MFNRRNALVGYFVMKAIRGQMRKKARRTRSSLDVDWAEAAKYLDAREHTRTAVSLSLVIGVVLGAIAWLATASRRR